MDFICEPLSPFRQWLALIAIRINPFIPSGAVNLAGALTSISFSTFLFATMIGKLPSIALEAWVGYGLIRISDSYIQLAITLVSLALALASESDNLRGVPAHYLKTRELL